MARRSNMAHNFSRVPDANIPRSVFDRGHGIKTAFDAGYLVPVLVDEVIPGDTLTCRMEGFGRLATPIHPFMDNLYIDSFFFFVPNRLVWDNWQKFNGEQDNPGDSTDFLVPRVAAGAGGYSVGDLGDYMGLPIGFNITHNALHTRAYNLIFREWFRDQNLQNSPVVDKDDGPDDIADYVLLKRGKRHDYFTSALPWPQKGDPVSLPLGTSAPVHSSAVQVLSEDFVSKDATGQVFFAANTVSGNELVADLANATAATINQIRQAFQIQILYERDARGGTRYIEIIRSHFGVTSPDARLQRPEYLGGGTSRINVSPVAQTSDTGAGTPQGNLAAFGTLNMQGHGFTKSFTEHGVILGLVSVRADLSYQQGMDKMWWRQSRWDFYWPALAHIGEQAVLSGEIYMAAEAGDSNVWGYQERWAEYRYKTSMITGTMRSNAPTPLDTWHLAQDFAARPTLNAAFIEEDPPVDRVIAVVTEPHILFDGWFDYRCARPMPTYGQPGLIDHF